MGKLTEAGNLKKRVWFAVAAWFLVAASAALPVLSRLLYRWLLERCRTGEAGLSGLAWTGVDLVFPFLFFWPQVLFCMLLLATAASWGVVVDQRNPVRSRAASIFAKGVACVSSIAVLLVGLRFVVLPVFVFVTRPLICETSVYERAVSPNGLYVASVEQIDCGAMTPFNRHVMLAPRLFPFAKSTVLYFRHQPDLHLRWSGRTLTVEGNRYLESMDHPPLDPSLWGGVLIRYSGPKLSSGSNSSNDD